MPRAAAPSSCRTCRRRKVKCDGRTPICVRCEKRGIICDRNSSPKIKEYRGPPLHGPLDASQPPVKQLENSQIAELLHVYIKELAPWYDLNDGHRAFALQAPKEAVKNPLLFAAMIAFAAIYTCRKKGCDMALAERQHARCLTLLIDIKDGDRRLRDGTALAAVCLLRSYEILCEDKDPNRHLFGASILIPRMPSLNDCSLLASGFWNYLREDITYSLMNKCPLKTQLMSIQLEPQTDYEFANAITVLLGRAINATFDAYRDDVSRDLHRWKHSLPFTPFANFDVEPFPVIRMLNDAQVASMHYYLVIQSIFQPSDRARLATEICGLACSALSDPVTVNVYGPIAFVGRWLTHAAQRQALLDWLESTRTRTTWPVQNIISSLKQDWTNEDRSKS